MPILKCGMSLSIMRCSGSSLSGLSMVQICLYGRRFEVHCHRKDAALEVMIQCMYPSASALLKMQNGTQARGTYMKRHCPSWPEEVTSRIFRQFKSSEERHGQYYRTRASNSMCWMRPTVNGWTYKNMNPDTITLSDNDTCSACLRQLPHEKEKRKLDGSSYSRH